MCRGIKARHPAVVHRPRRRRRVIMRTKRTTQLQPTSMNPHTPSRGPMPKPSQPATNRRRRRRPAARHRRWKLNTVLKPQRLRLRRTPPANRAISDYMIQQEVT